MSKKKKKGIKAERVSAGLSASAAAPDANLSNASGKSNLFSRLKANWLVVLIIAILSLGALGAGLKYLDEDARRER